MLLDQYLGVFTHHEKLKLLCKQQEEMNPHVVFIHQWGILLIKIRFSPRRNYEETFRVIT